MTKSIVAIMLLLFAGHAMASTPNCTSLFFSFPKPIDTVFVFGKPSQKKTTNGLFSVQIDTKNNSLIIDFITSSSSATIQFPSSETPNVIYLTKNSIQNYLVVGFRNGAVRVYELALFSQKFAASQNKSLMDLIRGENRQFNSNRIREHRATLFEYKDGEILNFEFQSRSAVSEIFPETPDTQLPTVKFSNGKIAAIILLD